MRLHTYSTMSLGIHNINKLCFLPSLIKLCTSDEVSNKELYPTFARTIFDDNSIGPSVLAILNHFNWNLVGIITENGQGWERRGDFLVSFLKSEGKTVSMHGKVQYGLVYLFSSEHSEHYEEVMRQMKDKARSECFLTLCYAICLCIS